MQILSFNFFIYSLSGVWRPISWSSNCAKLLYSAFTVFAVVPLYFFLLTQFMDIILVVDNIDDFTNNSLVLVGMISVCCKATVIVLRRKEIIGLVEMLLTEPCKPRDEDELAIQARFDKFIRSCSIIYMLMAMSSIASDMLRSVLSITQDQIPHRVWVPYDLNKRSLFLITSIHQIVTLFFATFMNVGTETLVFGLILQTCVQLDILTSRLNKIVDREAVGYRMNRPLALSKNQQTVISEHIHHHLIIYKYAKMVNRVFNQLLFVQFFGSIIVLCTSVYYISTHITEPEAMGIVVYTICMFAQIFIYCWAGNEVILKSASLTDVVYHVNWSSLPVSKRKDLLMIMMRSTIPFKFTSSFLINLSLQSYGNILKTSYLAFNMLQHLSGIWRPVGWSSSCAKLLYSAFTVFTVVPLYFMMLTQLMDVVLVVDNMDDFTNNSLLLVSVISVCCKATVAILRRKAIIGSVEMLLTEPCKPRDEDELAIQARFDAFIRSCSIKYLLLAVTSLTSIILRSLLNIIQGQLPYRVWLPYDSRKPSLFLITSIHQIVTSIFATFINVGTETLVFGFFLQTCAQLDILKCRLNKVVNNEAADYRANRPLSLPKMKQTVISQHIRHHLRIYKYAKMMNRVFNQVLFMQFSGSILVLCTSVYYISTHLMEPDAMGYIVYTICMFTQIFVYCWSGNEVILKVRQSASLAAAVYHADWSSLPVSERKHLLMIMMRSTIPIKFTSSFLITLTLRSYSNILKTSYSAFNVLQQS
ncbi:Odorant receptor 46a, isoform A [Harpegnathos saltator]|uniref:Odorant receptor 46a, isoform A n=1 Tax=Harpegnathos saltator TaxID=610380 RepID=E2BWG5_HARSA|nr:Odorant receptor 46a, isoform A [Harpegnathos saltator]